MSSPNRPARLNRTLLGLLGLILLAAGLFAVATHFGWLRVLKPDATLIPAGKSPLTWVYYVIAAGAVIIGVLCLRWLAAQAFRQPKSGTWRLERNPDTGVTRLEGSTAIQPLTDEIGVYQGVHSATGTLAGTRDNPTLYLRIGTEQGADLGEIRERIDSHALPRFRTALDLDRLPVQIVFRFTAKAGARAL